MAKIVLKKQNEMKRERKREKEFDLSPRELDEFNTPAIYKEVHFSMSSVV